MWSYLSTCTVRKYHCSSCPASELLQQYFLQTYHNFSLITSVKNEITECVPNLPQMHVVLCVIPLLHYTNFRSLTSSPFKLLQSIHLSLKIKKLLSCTSMHKPKTFFKKTGKSQRANSVLAQMASHHSMS